MVTTARSGPKPWDFTHVLDFHNNALVARRDASGADAGAGTNRPMNSPHPDPEPLPQSTPLPTASAATASIATQSHSASRDVAAGDKFGANGGAALGDFSSIFLFLGTSPEVPRSAVNPDTPIVLASKDDYASDGATYVFNRRSSVHRASLSNGTDATDGEQEAGGVKDQPLTRKQRKKQRQKENKAKKKQNEDMTLHEHLDRNHTGFVSESEVGSNFGGAKTPARKASSHVKSKGPIAAWNHVSKSLPPQDAANRKAAEGKDKQPANVPVQSPPKSLFRETFKKTSATQGPLGAPRKFDSAEYTTHDASGSHAVSAFDAEQFASAPAAAPATPSRVKGYGFSAFADPLARVAQRLGLPEQDVRKSLKAKSAEKGDVDTPKQAVDAVTAALAAMKHVKVPATASQRASPKVAPATPAQATDRPVTRSQTAQNGQPFLSRPAVQPPSFTPSTVQRPQAAPLQTAPPPQRNRRLPPPATLQPMIIRSGPDRNWALWTKLMDAFPENFATLVAPARLATHNNDDSGIHIFVDASNIFIGFMDSLKTARGIHPMHHMPEVDLCFDGLALILERGRPIAKRVLGGSNPWTKAHHQAKDIGYEMCMLEKTMKARQYTERQLHFNQQNAQRFNRNAKAPPVNSVLSSPRYAALNNNNGTPNGPSGAGTPAAPQYAPPKMVEQGVDEILHLKMLESIVDGLTSGKPAGTMVLATGDAASAEYSEGFMAMLERALTAGWKVELVSWRKNISQMYLNPVWTEAWKNQFRVVWLDPFAEELLDFAVPAGPAAQ